MVDGGVPGLYTNPDTGMNTAAELTLLNITVVSGAGVTITPAKTTESSGHSHPNNTATILVGRQSGMAPNASLYATSNMNNSLINIEALVDIGVTIINASVRYACSEENLSYAYTGMDRWTDHIVARHNITFVASAGNSGEFGEDWIKIYYDEDGKMKTERIFVRVNSPSTAYNAISVGAYDDKKTGINISDDELYSYSCYKNVFENKIACEKPDVVTPGSIGGGGTSSSAPVLTGMIALMLELKPALAAQPQAIKAIVLASCHRKVKKAPNQTNTETMAQGITDRQGAGAPDAWAMACIISQGTYGVGVMAKNTSTSTVRFTQPMYSGGNMNVSVTWLRESVATNDNHTSSSAGVYQNLDLFVYRNNTLIKSSEKEVSSTEMAYFPLSSTQQDYMLKLEKFGGSTAAVRYGYAWSTDNMHVTPNTMEGIYYITNNGKSNGYLTMNTSTNGITLTEYAGTANQQWILRKSTGNSYTLQSGYGSTAGTVTIGDSVVTGGVLKKVVVAGNTQRLVLLDKEVTTGERRDDGTYSIVTPTGDKIMMYSTNSTTGINTAVWNTYNGITSPNVSQRWQLEKINYRVGDVTKDGYFATTDTTNLQKYLAGTVSYDNVRLYLADVNRDGDVNIKDVTKLQRILSEEDLY